MKKVIILIVLMISFSFVNTACKQEIITPDENTKPNTNNIDKDLEDNKQKVSEDMNDSEKDDIENISDAKDDEEQIVIENKAFQIFQPTPGKKVKEKIIVKGLARVYEGTVLYEFEDGHNILNEGFTTATEGAPGWGKFEIIIKLDEKVANDSGSVILYEESAEDGARMNELVIPVKVIQ